MPPIHPQTATSTEVLLNNLAGSTARGVGAGDHASARYAFVFCAGAPGKALLAPKARENRRRIDEEGIAKMLIIPIKNE